MLSPGYGAALAHPVFSAVLVHLYGFHKLTGGCCLLPLVVGEIAPRYIPLP